MWFSPRRIPGTLSLALTNVMASLVVLDLDRYQSSPILVGPREFLPWWAWFTLLMGSGLGLILAVAVRSLTILHVSAGVSLSTWLAQVATMIVAFALGKVDPLIMSPLAWSLYAWIVTGQASMVLAPLWRPDLVAPTMLERRVEQRPCSGPERRKAS